MCKSKSKPFPQPLHDALITLLERWYDSRTLPETLLDLRIVRSAEQFTTEEPLTAAQAIVKAAIQELWEQSERLGKLLHFRHFQEQSVRATAQILHISESNYYKERLAAYEQLTLIIWRWEQQARQLHCKQCLLRLEASCSDRLIGRDVAITYLVDLLCQQQSPWIVAIEGMGGIGKTAFADAIMRRAIANGNFADFAWITMPQENADADSVIQTFSSPLTGAESMVDALITQLSINESPSATLTFTQKLTWLEERFRHQSHLVVIDGLAIHHDLQACVSLLRRWSNPTQFLITSRQQITDQGRIYHFSLPELSLTDVLTLIRQEANVSNLPHLCEANDAQLYPIYWAVGGNPLAIHFVLNQMRMFPITMVLDDLVQVHSRKVKAFYQDLYGQIWEHLHPQVRKVSMRIAMLQERRVTFDTVVSCGKFSRAELCNAIETLVLLNVINTHRNWQHYSYSLHNVTRTFLHSRVLHELKLGSRSRQEPAHTAPLLLKNSLNWMTENGRCGIT